LTAGAIKREAVHRLPVAHTLVIVESPTKARTIRGFLPKDFKVEASMGHVRDLPNNASEIPAAHKGEKWANLGVNTTNDFEPLYVVPKDKKKVVKELKDALKGADQLLLATDEDREGESISWHLLQLLNPKVPVKRMVFHEITKEAIGRALEQTRELDMELVHAQEEGRLGPERRKGPVRGRAAAGATGTGPPRLQERQLLGSQSPAGSRQFPL
jgi:DNA topoisomerase-1